MNVLSKHHRVNLKFIDPSLVPDKVALAEIKLSGYTYCAECCTEGSKSPPHSISFGENWKDVIGKHSPNCFWTFHLLSHDYAIYKIYKEGYGIFKRRGRASGPRWIKAYLSSEQFATFDNYAHGK